MNATTDRVALITGVGPGLGAALARRFSREGFAVGLIARSTDFTETLARELSQAGPRALAIAADAGQPNETAAAVEQVQKELGPINVLIHNASAALGQGLAGTTPEEFAESWRVTTQGAFVAARALAPAMISAGGGAMLFTGATSSVRGGGWLAFSSAKFALRGMVQSLARELWPKGVHVAHVVVDGIIESEDDAPATAAAPRSLLKPDEMAEAYWFLAQQPASAWTLELDLRPNGEEFFV